MKLEVLLLPGECQDFAAYWKLRFSLLEPSRAMDTSAERPGNLRSILEIYLELQQEWNVRFVGLKALSKHLPVLQKAKLNT